ncbi:MAG: hypothetical protein B6244_03530 [Candidatus Cloacimonetes bacterium 4572_55]|nr:MAG: hypothetical protein B6244_03530 [Candidatus Cloacimonetes bacterium 4572_55]
MEKKPIWRFIETGHKSAAYNMAVDEALTLHYSDQPTFRVYGWKPAAISFGYMQNSVREFDLERRRELGVSVVRRLTGGRAVYHDNEVTYSVVAPENDPSIGGTIHETYHAISLGLASGLAKLGIITELEKSRLLPDREKIKSPCFTASARYELTYRNKKLVGSAQRRISGMILQHGSILLAGHQEEMVELIRFQPDKKKCISRYLRQNTASLSGILGREVSFSEVSDTLRIGFGKYFDLDFRIDNLTPVESQTAERLIKDKYDNDAWNSKPQRG